MSEKWNPTPKERQYIDLIASMCIDTACGSGVNDCATFVSNLRMIANQMENLSGEQSIGAAKQTEKTIS